MLVTAYASVFDEQALMTVTKFWTSPRAHQEARCVQGLHRIAHQVLDSETWLLWVPFLDARKTFVASCEEREVDRDEAVGVGSGSGFA